MSRIQINYNRGCPSRAGCEIFESEDDAEQFLSYVVPDKGYVVTKIVYWVLCSLSYNGATAWYYSYVVNQRHLWSWKKLRYVPHRYVVRMLARGETEPSLREIEVELNE